MIKYLGSKRRLVPVLGKIATAVRARTAVDLFTGTTRVAQAFKRLGIHVTAVDIASYSDVLARCYIETDSATVDQDRLAEALAELNRLPGRPGYFTRTFCVESRFFRPDNGARIDAIRDHLKARYQDSELFCILLTALLIAADRVDSTTGVQMAYLKDWAPRAHHDLELVAPQLLPGSGVSLLGDALALAPSLPPVDLAYLDPPYNQHRYFTNYHIWETLVRWDEPDAYGVARKRVDARDPSTKSRFNRKRDMPEALRSVIEAVRAGVLVVSYNDESWIEPHAVVTTMREAGYDDVRVFAHDSKRYVGAQIGIFNPAGQRVGQVSRLRNTEYVFVGGPLELVDAVNAAMTDTSGAPATVPPLSLDAAEV